MGGGAGKQKKKNDQPPQTVVVEEQLKRTSIIAPRLPSPANSDRLHYTPIQGAAGHSRASLRSPAGHSRASLRSPAVGDTIVNRPDTTPSPPPGSALPRIPTRSPSNHSRRASTLSKKRPSVGARSPTGSDHHHGHSSLSGHGQANRYCSHCPHCKRRSNGGDSTSSTPTPAWLKVKPDDSNVCINMDQYDTDGQKQKSDRQRDLSLLTATSFGTKTDYDTTKENYFTLPFVAKTSPRVTPTSTPFPGYSSLQRKERRANKPFTATLFVD